MEAAVARRALILWVLARLAVGIGRALLGDGTRALDPRASLLLVLVVGTLSWIDTRRRGEALLLANLGRSRMAIHLLGVGPALVLEGIIAAVVGT